MVVKLVLKRKNENIHIWSRYSLFKNTVCRLPASSSAALNFCLKLDSNHPFFGPCDLQIWWMTLKNNRAPLLYYIKLCASFQTHWWIQTAVTVHKCSIWVRIGDFLSCVTLKFGGWHWQTIGHLFFATSSFVNHFKAIGEFKLEWQSWNAQFRSKSAIFVICDLEISRMTLKNNRAPLLCYFKIWALFCTYLWIRTGVTFWKIPMLGQNQYFF